MVDLDERQLAPMRVSHGHQRMIARRPLAFAFTSIAACASTVSPATDGSSADRIACPVDAGVEFSASLAVCTRASDCVVVTHGLDCCGSRELVGINAAQRDAYNAPEAVCEMRLNFGRCRCVAQPSVAQDGRILPDGANAVVDCIGGLCLTHAP